MATPAKPVRLAAATHVLNARPGPKSWTQVLGPRFLDPGFFQPMSWTCDRSSDRPGFLILLAPRRRIVGASPTAFTIVGPVTRAAKGAVS